MISRRLANGLMIRRYRLRPDFDVSQLAERERARYGLPRWTEEPELQRRFDAKLKSPLIFPRFGRSAPRTRTRPRFQREYGPQTNASWSGAIVDAPANSSLSWVDGTWTVPKAELPLDAQDATEYLAAVWLGLDGASGTDDVVQAGCSVSVVRTNGATKYDVEFWFEWYPANPTPISNLSAAPGDVISCLIALLPGDRTQATISLANQTKPLTLEPFTVSSSLGQPLTGNTAEWILEGTGHLPDFETVTFNNCSAGAPGGTLVHLSRGNAVSMVDEQGQIISSASVISPTSVQIAYA